MNNDPLSAQRATFLIKMLWILKRLQNLTIIQRIVLKYDLHNLIIINNEHHRLLDSSIIMH